MNPDDNTPTYDVIVVGGGTAGCLLANRLSADPQRRVLLVEAGGHDDYHWIHIPVGYLYCIGNPRTDWLYFTEPDPGLNGRKLRYPRGKVMGGCSSINGMIYMRGQSRDYDNWARLTGDANWRWEHCLPFFKQHEDHWRGGDALHGAGNEWRVEKQRLQLGDPRRLRCCGARGRHPGHRRLQPRQQRRCRLLRGQPEDRRALEHREGVFPPRGGAAEPAGLDRRDDLARAAGRRARGRHRGAACWWCRWRRAAAGTRRTTRWCCAPVRWARRRSCSCRASGRARCCKAWAFRCSATCPVSARTCRTICRSAPCFRVDGVKTLNTMASSLWGKAKIGLEYALRRSGPMSMAPSQLGAFTRSAPGHAWPNVEYHVQPLSLDAFGEPLHSFNAFTASVCNLNPTARGHIRIASPNAHDAPKIQANYLSTPEDRQVAADSLRLTRRIAAMPALAKYRPQEVKPGVQYQSDDELARLAGDIGTTIFHPVGTCRMGADDDTMAVVDSQLRVRGVPGLRIADASVMPTITSGNTNAPTLMIAERAAAWIVAGKP